MAKFTARPGLNAIVAERFVRAKVDQVIEHGVGVARRNAPGTKYWLSRRDAVVRPEHRRADGQEVPDNLRFTVKSHPWDMEHRGVGTYTYMIRPKDQSSHALVNLRNCRCAAVPGSGVAAMVYGERAVVSGARVSGAIVAEGNLVVQAEYGDVYPGGLVAEGTFFMTRTAAQLAAASLI